MEQKVKLISFNPHLNIGMADRKRVCLLTNSPTLLSAEVYRGKLIYRAKGSSKRISYDELKKGMVKRTIWIREEVLNWVVISKSRKKLL